MCGIAGFFSLTQEPSRRDLEAMANAIAHRGPDALGYFLEEKTGLGHRRLSILDLSAGANQPMTSACGRYVIVYNGEVYNFREIAKELDQPLHTTGDTEVILEAFAKWGPECVHRLNGMFAFAIYDRNEKRIHLCRDRLGIKPLYYFWDGATLLFSSELKSLTALDSLRPKLTVSRTAISYFLHIGYIPHPHSIFNEVRKLDAGHWAVVSAGGLSITPYWTPEEQIDAVTLSDRGAAKKQLKELLTSSVKYRMISDVPFGTFLSGGIDSSIVTAIAQSLSSRPVKTFTIAFEEAGFNEAPHARAVARHLQTDHHEFRITSRVAIPLVEKILDVYDEPFSNSSSIPTLLVSEMARRHVKMTLSGDGGDELFLGYGMHEWANRLGHPLVSALRGPIRRLLARTPGRYGRASGYFGFPNAATVHSHIFSQQQGSFSLAEVRRLLKPLFYTEPRFEEGQPTCARALSPAERQAFFDLKYYLRDELLVKVDRASMRHSLETRVPLLDYRIVKFALNLAPELKKKDGTTKLLLKDVLFDFVPRALFDRPKWGFPSPLGAWLRGELRYLVDEYLARAVIERAELVEFEYVRRLREEFLAGNDALNMRVWLLILLHKWLGKNEYAIQ